LDYRLLRKHYILSFNPKAVVYHYRPDTCAGFLSLMFRYGFGQGLLVKKYSFFKAIQYIPFASMLLVLFFFIILFMNIKLGLAAVLLFSLLSVSYFSFNPAVLFLSMRGILLWHLGFIKGILSGEKP
ncbi:MAG: hypothetical protein NT033_04880, partial [Candidatus Omnitrophica bacterium]|nr:hypothetical protein [Candidatus Omnitrophota bacterium]